MKKILLLVIAAAFVFGGTQAQTLVVAQGSDAVILSPFRTNDQPSARVMRQVYDTLIIQNEQTQLEPGLAVSWEQVDDVTWIFNLREGVVFHNGDPFTAHDVKYSLDTLRDPATAAPAAFLVGFIKEVDVVDDHTIMLHFNNPFAPALAHLAHTATSIVNARAAQEAGADYGTSVVVGTGPFSFVSWTAGDSIRLARNPNYWGGEVLPAEVIFRNVTDNSVRAIEVETGGVDIAYGIVRNDADRLRSNPNVDIVSVQTLSTAYVGFNVQKAPFDNVLVRRAINHALDIDTIVEVTQFGAGVPARSPISELVFGSNQDLEPYAYDPELARQLLAEAGFPNGFSTSLWTNDNPTRIQIAEIAQAQLADVGITVDVQVVEWGAYLADTAAGLHDMFILGWVTVTADAD